MTQRAVPLSPAADSPLWPATQPYSEGSQRSKGGQRAVRCAICPLLSTNGGISNDEKDAHEKAVTYCVWGQESGELKGKYIRKQVGDHRVS